MNDKAKRFSLCVSLLDCRHTNSLAFKTNLIRVGRLIQWSAVRVTAVTVTVGYSDRFGNPRFITNSDKKSVTVTPSTSFYSVSYTSDVKIDPRNKFFR